MKRTKCPPHTTLTTPRRTADRHLLGHVNHILVTRMEQRRHACPSHTSSIFIMTPLQFHSSVAVFWARGCVLTSMVQGHFTNTITCCNNVGAMILTSIVAQLQRMSNNHLTMMGVTMKPHDNRLRSECAAGQQACWGQSQPTTARCC
jgi:hypothetical protein